MRVQISNAKAKPPNPNRPFNANSSLRSTPQANFTAWWSQIARSKSTISKCLKDDVSTPEAPKSPCQVRSNMVIRIMSPAFLLPADADGGVPSWDSPTDSNQRWHAAPTISLSASSDIARSYNNLSRNSFWLSKNIGNEVQCSDEPDLSWTVPPFLIRSKCLSNHVRTFLRALHLSTLVSLPKICKCDLFRNTIAATAFFSGTDIPCLVSSRRRELVTGSTADDSASWLMNATPPPMSSQWDDGCEIRPDPGWENVAPDTPMNGTGRSDKYETMTQEWANRNLEPKRNARSL